MVSLNKLSYRELLADKDFYIATPVGTSMMPMIRERIDTVKLVKPKGRLKKYDVILYQRKDGTYVLHRIIGVRKDSYVLCGDNQFTKEFNVTDDMIIGVVDGFYRGEKYISNDDKEYIKYYKKRVRSRNIRKIKYYLKKILNKKKTQN